MEPIAVSNELGRSTSQQGQPQVAVRARARLGFTLIELIMAIAVLSIGLMAVMGQFADMKKYRTLAEQDVVASRIILNLSERVAAANWEDLNTKSAPWSYVRFMDGTGNPAMTEANLEAYGVISPQAGVTASADWKANLKVYFEYYRYVNSTAFVTSGNPLPVGLSNYTNSATADATAITGVPDFLKQFNAHASGSSNIRLASYVSGSWSQIIPDEPLNDGNLLLYPSIGGNTQDGQYSPNTPYKLADPTDHDLTDPVLIRIVVVCGSNDWVTSGGTAKYVQVAGHTLVKFLLKKG